jgi:hypothetical protein
MARSKAEQTRLVALITVLGVLIVVAAVRLIRLGGLAGGSTGGRRVVYETHDLPELETAQLDREVSEDAASRRNPFTYGVRPTPTPRPVTPVPTRPPVRRTPPPTPTPRLSMGLDGKPKPPPPPFDRTYIGHFGPVDLQIVAFRKAGTDDPEISEVEVFRVGDVIDEIFIVRDVGLESVEIGFVGYDPSEDTRVPLAEE